LSDKGVRVNPGTVYRMVNTRLALVTSVKKKSPHVLRHSFATAMLNNNAEIGAVKELLGHRQLATTEIYTHLSFEDLKGFYEKAHPRAGKQ
jgi:integrase/recombinase XerC